MSLFGSYFDYINKRRDYGGGLTDRLRWDLTSPAFSLDVLDRIEAAKKKAGVNLPMKKAQIHEPSVKSVDGVTSGKNSDYAAPTNDSPIGKYGTTSEENAVYSAMGLGAVKGALPGLATAAVASQMPGMNFGSALGALAGKIGMDSVGGALKGGVGELASQTLKAAGYVGKWAEAGQKFVGMYDAAATPFGFGIPAGLGDVASISSAILGDALGDALDKREVEALRDMMEANLGDDLGKALVGQEIAKIGTSEDPYGTKAMQKNFAAITAEVTNEPLGSVMSADQTEVSSDTIGLISNARTMSNALRSGFNVNEYGFVQSNPFSGMVNLDLQLDPYSYDFQPQQAATSWLDFQNTMFDQTDKQLLQSMDANAIRGTWADLLTTPGRAIEAGYSALSDSLGSLLGNVGSFTSSAVDSISQGLSDTIDAIGSFFGGDSGGGSDGSGMGYTGNESTGYGMNGGDFDSGGSNGGGSDGGGGRGTGGSHNDGSGDSDSGYGR